jgi:hypothetical protein
MKMASVGVFISECNFSTTLKTVLTAGYGFGIGGLSCGELVKLVDCLVVNWSNWWTVLW